MLAKSIQRGKVAQKLDKQSKKLFLEIHNEYQFQHCSIRGESDYSYELLQLQQRLLKGEKLEMIEETYNQLKMKNQMAQAGLHI